MNYTFIPKRTHTHIHTLTYTYTPVVAGTCSVQARLLCSYMWETHTRTHTYIHSHTCGCRDMLRAGQIAVQLHVGDDSILCDQPTPKSGGLGIPSWPRGGPPSPPKPQPEHEKVFQDLWTSDLWDVVDRCRCALVHVCVSVRECECPFKTCDMPSVWSGAGLMAILVECVCVFACICVLVHV
jgi:hypothetical protein